MIVTAKPVGTDLTDFQQIESDLSDDTHTRVAAWQFAHKLITMQHVSHDNENFECSTRFRLWMKNVY